MSMITLAITKNRESRTIILHYQRALDLLNNKLKIKELEEIFEASVKDKNPWPYDAGIIFIDMDKKKITSFQSGFGMHNINEKSRNFLIEKYEVLFL